MVRSRVEIEKSGRQALAEGVDGAVGIDIARRGAAGLITLQRPEARNALNDAMRRRLAEAFPAFARDPQIYGVVVKSALDDIFCAGGDVRELVHLARSEPDRARQSLAREYALNWLHECFSKPTVSLINGPVMGSGVGITLYGTHRVAGEDYRFSMPETAIGFFPDDGVAHTFARLPHELGLFLGLTGRAIGPADAYRLGLVTHTIPAARFAEIEAAVVEADPIDPVLDARHDDPGAGELERYAEVIERCFSAPTLPDIIERLRSERCAREWCEGVLADLAGRSPLALAVTLAHIRWARALDLRQTLTVDYRLACRMIMAPDFAEGVCARLIKKDRAPRWRPERLEDVSEAMVERVFQPLPGAELVLPTRQEMQAARV
ncbi:MAG TPA: enoyl-CoA hydratase/isomerase family protein [Hyphomicrobiaceae bacterium]|nr:enoyl-CoA hydratase/isomerase family protein [Hyphomicrobiaceae bacterium]